MSEECEGRGTPPSLPSRLRRAALSGRAAAPGLAIAAVIAMAATFVSEHYGGPVMLYALLLGMAFHFLSLDAGLAIGIDLAARTVLRLGVALLGARITADQVVALGPTPVLLVVGGIVATLAFGQAVARGLGLHREFGLLSGVAVSICGVSAALTAAAVLPKRPDSERNTILVCLGVTTLSTTAMVLYPLIASLAGLDQTAAGIFLGATIHDVAQVVGAGYMMSEVTGNVATLTKLLRVACLVPVTLVITLIVAGWLRREQGADAGARPGPSPSVGLPWFLVAFAVIVGLNSIGAVPAVATETAGTVSRACLVVAIASIGIKTSFQDLAVTGWRPAALIVAETLFLAVLVLGALAVIG